MKTRQRLTWINLYEETQDEGLVCRRCVISRPNCAAVPHLNGKVERAWKTVLTEFFALKDLQVASLEVLNHKLALWQHYYNWERVHGNIKPSTMEKFNQLSSQTPF